MVFNFRKYDRLKRQEAKRLANNPAVDTGDLGTLRANKGATANVKKQLDRGTIQPGSAGDLAAETYLETETITNKEVKIKFDNKKPQYETNNEGKTLERELLKNILHDFATYNAVITLGVLDIEEVNFPHVIQKKGLKYPIAQTAGKQGPEVSVFKDAGYNLEYLIDNLEIQGVVAPNLKTRHTQATKISFEVHEPYSLGVFFQTMRIQAMKAYDNDITTDHLKVPYCLYIEFIGNQDDGESYTIPALRRVIPIGIQQVEVRANAGGSVYQVTAYPWNEYAFRNMVNSIEENITLSGSTVYEMLQSGENSLMKYLNSLHKRDAKGKAKAKDPKNPVIPPTDNTVIFFPKDFGDPKDYAVPQSTLDELKVDRSVIYGDDGEEYQSVFELKKRDTLVEKFLKNGNAETVTVMNQYSRTEAEGISVDQKSGELFGGNDIGAAKITINENNLNQLMNVFPDWKTSYDAKTKVYKRNNMVVDLTKQNLSFQKGTAITDIIENVILLSEYGARLGKRFSQQEKNNSSEFVSWFRIHPQVFQLKDNYIYSVMKRHPSVNVYNVIPYLIPKAVFIDPSEYVSEFNYLRSMVQKKYEYIYTGLNQDILDFEILYRFAFFKQTPSQYNKTANTSIVGDNESLDNATAKKTDQTYGQKSSIGPNANSNPTNVGADQDKSRQVGTGSESPELKIAREVNENIVSSNVDLFELNLRIVGDTYFLPNSGMGNYVSKVVDRREIYNEEGQKRTVAAVFSNADGEAALINGQILVEVDFKTPIDLGKEGDMEFASFTSNTTTSDKLGEFSGVYRVTNIVSHFRQGKFEQEVKMIKPQNMELQQPSDNSGKKADNNKNPYQADDAFSTEDGGLGQSA